MKSKNNPKNKTTLFLKLNRGKHDSDNLICQTEIIDDKTHINDIFYSKDESNNSGNNINMENSNNTNLNFNKASFQFSYTNENHKDINFDKYDYNPNENIDNNNQDLYQNYYFNSKSERSFNSNDKNIIDRNLCFEEKPYIYTKK